MLRCQGEVGIVTDEPSQNPKTKWKNRRWMAWAAMVSGLTFPFVAAQLMSEAQLDKVIWPFFSFIGMVVGAYVGATSIADIWGKK
jgi:hypothetical protein